MFTLLVALALGEAVLAQSNKAASGAASDEKLQAKAKELHKKIIAFDSHVDLPLEFGSPGLEATTDGKSQFDLAKTNKGGLKGAALAVFVAQGARTAENLAQAKADAEKKHQIITGIAKTYPDRAAIAYTPDDVRRIAKGGKFVIVESFLNTWPLGNDLSQLDEWHRKGVRIFGFVHAGHNDWSDSSRPSKPLGDKLDEHGGLSPLGKQAVTRLNELGALIDVSQLSTKAFFDTLKLTKAPVAATHSGVRGLVDATRNLNDEELLALKANVRGGIAGTVTDASGAALPGTTVRITNKATAASRSVEAGKDGEFLVPELALGFYTVEVVKSGFQPLRINDVEVTVSKVTGLELQLSVAQLTEVVEVSASNVVRLDTSSSTLTGIVAPKQVQDLPLNGRDFRQMIQLTPGVTIAGSINGSRTRGNNYQIDGADNNDAFQNASAVNQGGVSGIAGTLLPIEAIDQFSVQSGASAEAGRNSGGAINLVIKSGSNNLHGSAYYFNGHPWRLRHLL